MIGRPRGSSLKMSEEVLVGHLVRPILVHLDLLDDNLALPL